MTPGNKLLIERTAGVNRHVCEAKCFVFCVCVHLRGREVFVWTLYSDQTVLRTPNSKENVCVHIWQCGTCFVDTRQQGKCLCGHLPLREMFLWTPDSTRIFFVDTWQRGEIFVNTKQWGNLICGHFEKRKIFFDTPINEIVVCVDIWQWRKCFCDHLSVKEMFVREMFLWALDSVGKVCVDTCQRGKCFFYGYLTVRKMFVLTPENEKNVYVET